MASAERWPAAAWIRKLTSRWYEGTPVDGAVSLRRFLLSNEDLFLTNFTRNLLMYASGRVFQPYDMPAVRAIVRDAAQQDHRFSAYVMGVVTSAPFQMRRSDAAPDTTAAADAGAQ